MTDQKSSELSNQSAQKQPAQDWMQLKDKDIKHIENIKRKISLSHFTGVYIEAKRINQSMDNIVFVLETSPHIVNLKFENTTFGKEGVTMLSKYLENNQKCNLETIGFNKVTFETLPDQKKIFESLQKNNKLKKLELMDNTYNYSGQGEFFRNLAFHTTSIIELDISWSRFENQSIFQQLALGICKESIKKENEVQLRRNPKVSKISTLKIRSFYIDDLINMILCLILTNAGIQILDISQSQGRSENFTFLYSIGKKCAYPLKSLSMESLETDVNGFLSELGASIAGTKHLEILNMRNNKIKEPQYKEFWTRLMPNRSLKILNLEKTRANDRVVAKIAEYLMQTNTQLEELNLSKNSIKGEGLKSLSNAISQQKTLKKLNLTQTEITEENLNLFSAAMRDNSTIEELYFGNNELTFEGVKNFSDFLVHNRSLQILDISKCGIKDDGISYLAQNLKFNEGLTNLNLSKNSDITDQEGLKSLFENLADNKFLKILDISSIKVRRLYLTEHFKPQLRKNIYLQKIIGRIPPNIIDSDLEDNKMIEDEIIPKLEEKSGDGMVWLNLGSQKLEILRPALKLIRIEGIQNINLSGMQIDDEALQSISKYLCEKCCQIKRLILNDNLFTDNGFKDLILALKTNTSLNVLQVLNCTKLTDSSMTELKDVITNVNMSLYDIQFDLNLFDTDLALEVKNQYTLNKDIKKKLNPQRKKISDKDFEVVFDQDCRYVEYFPSVVKCWKVMAPNQITACNEGLEDSHIEKLSEYLIQQEVIKKLILRRNNISDKGAEALAKFIETNNKSFKHLELSRNRIKEAGAKAILKALEKNSRITTLLIDFGNEISQKMALKIQYEIIANNHIENYAKQSLRRTNNEQYGRLTIQDKGPEFLRCATKAIQLFKLQHLNLSDNLIGFKETKKIMNLIEKNYPLKSLNLSNNLLDPKCARLISNALKKNTNLLDLDVSYNQISDSGIALIILPLAKQKLQHIISGINSGKRPSKIRKLFLSYNKHTDEALKHVLALLFANRQVFVYINNPSQLNDTLNLKKNSVAPGVSSNQSSPKKQNASFQRGQTLGRSNFTPKAKQQFSDLDLGRLAPIQERNKKINAKKISSNISDQNQSLNSTQGVLLRNIQYKDHYYSHQNRDLMIQIDHFDEPFDLKKRDLSPNQNSRKRRQSIMTLTKFCCGRKDQSQQNKSFISRFFADLSDNKKVATTFKCNENILTNVETVSQKYITVALYLSIFAFYITALVIPITEKGDCQTGHDISTYMYYAIYIVSSWLMELSLCIYLQKKVGNRNVLQVNKFHLMKLFTGQLGRMDFFTDMLFIVQLYKCQIMNMLYISCIFLALSTTYQVIMVFRLMKKDNNLLLENIERNCKLAYISEHQALAIILDSFSLSNFESVGKKTITVPKIISMIKSFIEDFPQFSMQVVYILKYGETNGQTGTIALSIFLGAMSFCLSVHHAMTAKASRVEIDKAMEKINERIDAFYDFDLDMSFIDKDDEEDNKDIDIDMNADNPSQEIPNESFKNRKKGLIIDTGISKSKTKNPSEIHTPLSGKPKDYNRNQTFLDPGSGTRRKQIKDFDYQKYGRQQTSSKNQDSDHSQIQLNFTSMSQNRKNNQLSTKTL